MMIHILEARGIIGTPTANLIWILVDVAESKKPLRAASERSVQSNDFLARDFGNPVDIAGLAVLKEAGTVDFRKSAHLFVCLGVRDSLGV